MSVSDLLAELAIAPRLDAALCRGQYELFDSDDDALTAGAGALTAGAGALTAGAGALCCRCPALGRPCTVWAASMPPGSLAGVVAGVVREPAAVAELDELCGADTVAAASVTARIAAFVSSRSEPTCAGDLAENPRTLDAKRGPA